MRTLLIAAAATLLAAPATAQESLTEDSVESFVAEAVEEAQQLVDDGDWAGIQSWYEKRLSETAQIAARATMLVKGGPTMTFSIAMNAADAQGATGMMGHAHGQQNPIEDFNLEADVLSVTELPDGGASAVVVFNESGAIAMPANPDAAAQSQSTDAPDEAATSAAAEQGGDSVAADDSATAPGARRLVFQTSSTCNMRLATDGGESIKIEMIACDSVATMG